MLIYGFLIHKQMILIEKLVASRAKRKIAGWQVNELCLTIHDVSSYFYVKAVS